MQALHAGLASDRLLKVVLHESTYAHRNSLRDSRGRPISLALAASIINAVTSPNATVQPVGQAEASSPGLETSDDGTPMVPDTRAWELVTMLVSHGYIAQSRSTPHLFAGGRRCVAGCGTESSAVGIPAALLPAQV